MSKKVMSAEELEALLKELGELREATAKDKLEISRLSGELSRVNGERETMGVQITNYRNQVEEMRKVIEQQSKLLLAHGQTGESKLDALIREKMAAGLPAKDALKVARNQIALDAEREREEQAKKNTAAA